MGDRLERTLNTLLIVSTCIVALSIFDRTSDLMTTITDDYLIQAEPTVSMSTEKLQNLTIQCADVWESHSSHNKEQEQRTIDWKSQPKYDTATTPKDSSFCSRIPKDVSAAHLWNNHLEEILEASSNVDEIATHLLTAKLLQFLTPSKYLDLGHRSRPSRRAWGNLLHKIQARMVSDSAPMVHIVAFGAGSMNCELVEPGAETPRENATEFGAEQEIDCLWPVRLEALVNNLLNRGKRDGDARGIINITPMYHPPNIATTTEFDTEIVKQGAWVDFIVRHGGPDVILSAFNAHDMYLPKRGWKTAEDINYYHHQRQMIQDFLRTCLQVPTCNSQKEHEPPLVISVDDYVGNQHGPIMAENVQARVLQLLSDYYETGFVSYAEVIRKLVYLSDDSPLEHAALKEWASDWTSLTTTGTSTSTTTDTTAQVATVIQHGMIGPIAMTMTLAYSFLKTTISYCSEQSSRMSTDNEEEEEEEESDNSIISKEALRLADEVPPPYLDTDLTLGNVMEKWDAEKPKEDQRNELCKTKPASGKPENCVFEFWGGIKATATGLKEYLDEYLEGDMTGWEAREGGTLFATQEQASLHLRFVPLREDHWTLRLFSVFRDKDPSKLHWEISTTGGGRRRGRKLLPHHNSTTKADSESRRLQANTKTGTIDGTHDTPATVALPTTIDLDMGTFKSTVDLKLQLIEGSEFEIVGMFFCSSS